MNNDKTSSNGSNVIVEEEATTTEEYNRCETNADEVNIIPTQADDEKEDGRLPVEVPRNNNHTRASMLNPTEILNLTSPNADDDDEDYGNDTGISSSDKEMESNPAKADDKRNIQKETKVKGGKKVGQQLHQKKRREKDESTTINEEGDDLEASKMNSGTETKTAKGSIATSTTNNNNSLSGRIRRMILPGAIRVPGSSTRTSLGGGGGLDSDYFSGYLSTLSMGNNNDNSNSNTNDDRMSMEFRKGGGGGGSSSHFSRPLDAEIVPSREETLQSRINSLTVDAVNVVQVPTSHSPSSTPAGDIQDTNLRNKKKTLTISGLVIFGILCLAIILPTVLLLGKGNNKQKELGNGDGKKDGPMMERALDLLSPISAVDVLLDESTPQHQALLWLVHDDPSKVFYHYHQSLTTAALSSGGENTTATMRSGGTSMTSPSDSTTTTTELEIIERYVIVLLYFATGGGSASETNSAMTTATEEEGGGEEEDDGPAPWENKDNLNFLSESSVCEWPPIQEDENVNYVIGIRCNDVGSVHHIRLGTYTLAPALQEFMAAAHVDFKICPHTPYGCFLSKHQTIVV